MGQVLLKCDRPAALAIYEHLAGLNFDTGYHHLNYWDSSKPKETIEGKGNGEISCEEIWENGLRVLDSLGQLADWEEELVEIKNGDGKKAIDQKKATDQNKAIEQYQQFRALIECQTKRPIPWVLEAPYLCKNSILGKREIPRDQQKLREAQAIRTKVNGAIKKLNKLLKEEKLKPVQHQQGLIAFLYWFVLVGTDVEKEPLYFDGEKKTSQLESFLVKQGLDLGVIQKIKEEFREYLVASGGGLGLAYMGEPNADAEFEATALETMLGKKGWCTEQSKVMYAVLRMAKIEAFFVEPQLSIEYYLAKNKQPPIPLPSHMASGVGVKIIDENGKEKIWIVDVALQLLEADYIKEKPGQWKAHPYWELSLRHFFMADLANLGGDQTAKVEGLIKKRKFKEAKEKLREASQNFEMALQLGEDSTAFHTFGN